MTSPRPAGPLPWRPGTTPTGGPGRVPFARHGDLLPRPRQPHLRRRRRRRQVHLRRLPRRDAVSGVRHPHPSGRRRVGWRHPGGAPLHPPPPAPSGAEDGPGRLIHARPTRYLRAGVVRHRGRRTAWSTSTRRATARTRALRGASSRPGPSSVGRVSPCADRVAACAVRANRSRPRSRAAAARGQRGAGRAPTLRSVSSARVPRPICTRGLTICTRSPASGARIGSEGPRTPVDVPRRARRRVTGGYHLRHFAASAFAVTGVGSRAHAVRVCGLGCGVIDERDQHQTPGRRNVTMTVPHRRPAASSGSAGSAGSAASSGSASGGAPPRRRPGRRRPSGRDPRAGARRGRLRARRRRDRVARCAGRRRAGPARAWRRSPARPRDRPRRGRRATRVVDRCSTPDPEVVPGRYSLEVSSPGLERPLRTPAHFGRALGRRVTLRTPARDPGRAPCRRGPRVGRRRRVRRRHRRRPPGRLRRHRARPHRLRVGAHPPPGTPGRRGATPSRPVPGRRAVACRLARGPAAGRPIHRDGPARPRFGRPRFGRSRSGRPRRPASLARLPIRSRPMKLNPEFMEHLETIEREKASRRVAARGARQRVRRRLQAEPERGRGGDRQHRSGLRRRAGDRPGARRGRQRRARVRRHPEGLRAHRHAGRQAGAAPEDPGDRAAQKYSEYAGREGDIVTGIIQQQDHRYTLLDLAAWRPCCRRPSRCPRSATSTGTG